MILPTKKDENKKQAVEKTIKNQKVGILSVCFIHFIWVLIEALKFTNIFYVM